MTGAALSRACRAMTDTGRTEVVPTLEEPR